MTNLEKFKYKDEIEELIKSGISLPNKLVATNNIDSYRFGFNSDNPNNHLPTYKQIPKRIIEDKKKSNLTTKGYALSCFDTDKNANKKFQRISKLFPNFYKTVGYSIYFGKLVLGDGLITSVSQKGHFSLFEFIDFDTNKKFTFVKVI